jgi:hypothetical protein
MNFVFYAIISTKFNFKYFLKYKRKFNFLFYKHLEVDIVQSKFVIAFHSLQKQVKRKAPMSENKENGKSKSKQAKEDHTGSLFFHEIF